MANSPNNGRCRVLVAEDDPLNVMLVEQVLHLFGCDVEVVGTGRAAVQARQAGDFHLLLLDYQMPDMNGLEAARALREWETRHDHPRVPIVGLTASAMPDQISQCLLAGMDKVVTKPFDLTALRTLVVSYCSGQESMG